jgi:hydrogenase nickel incorporation protein HypA/HybF
MHEYSIVQALYEKVAAEAAARGARSVHAVRVRIGELSGIDAGLLETAWNTFRVRTLCDAAPIEIEPIPAEWVCVACGAAVPRGGVLACRSCGAPARLAAGDEILLQQIDMEVGDV